MSGSEGSERGRGPVQGPPLKAGPSREELMRFIDGELEPARAAEATAYLLEHPYERAAVQRMLVASDIVVNDVWDRADEAGVDSIAASVMAQIDRGQSGATKASRSIKYLVPAVGAAGFVMAAAAAFFLWLRVDRGANMASHLGKLAPNDATADGVEIESVDFGSRIGQVVYLRTSPDKPPTPVVWVSDDSVRAIDGGKP